jgi:HSP20 family molecular chaperone IbpA
MATTAPKFDSIRTSTCPPDTSTLDEAWPDAPAPRDSYVALKAAGAALPALPPPPRLGAASMMLTHPSPSGALRCDLSYDVWDSPRAMLVLVELPGIAPEHISANLGSHSLHVVVNVPEGVDNCGVSSGHHELSVELPTGVPPDALDASLANGLLRIRIPKPAAGPRRLIPTRRDE